MLSAGCAFADEQLAEIEPTIVQQIDQGGDVAYPDWLAYGPITQYPAEGGTWQYGFGDVKVRSYYTVNLKHESTVVLNGEAVHSADTAAGYKSIAEKWAVQWPSNDDRYYYRICE